MSDLAEKARKWLIENLWTIQRLAGDPKSDASTCIASLTTLLESVAREASRRLSVPNPCSICHCPIYWPDSFTGTGDGQMCDGGSFAHSTCYQLADAKKELDDITARARAMTGRNHKMRRLIDEALKCTSEERQAATKQVGVESAVTLLLQRYADTQKENERLKATPLRALLQRAEAKIERLKAEVADAKNRVEAIRELRQSETDQACAYADQSAKLADARAEKAEAAVERLEAELKEERHDAVLHSCACIWEEDRGARPLSECMYHSGIREEGRREQREKDEMIISELYARGASDIGIIRAIRESKS